MTNQLAKQKLVIMLSDLQKTVAKMSQLYDENPELNDEVDISKIVPMSLDEWSMEIPEVMIKIRTGK